MSWRRLRPGELDHEAIWLVVSLAMLLGAWFWLYLALPIPECTFHRVTGLACPTCGITRCVRHALHGHWKTAATFNPVAMAGLGFVAIFDFYAAAVLLFRLPRLRFDHLTPLARNQVRYAAITAILGNWAWLLWLRL